MEGLDTGNREVIRKGCSYREASHQDVVAIGKKPLGWGSYREGSHQKLKSYRGKATRQG